MSVRNCISIYVCVCMYLPVHLPTYLICEELPSVIGAGKASLQSIGQDPGLQDPGGIHRMKCFSLEKVSALPWSLWFIAPGYTFLGSLLQRQSIRDFNCIFKKYLPKQVLGAQCIGIDLRVGMGRRWEGVQDGLPICTP